jgi:uncharacterized membrane protein YjjP (DUF1212 family)
MELLAAANTMLFILCSMFAGVSLGQSRIGAFAFFAVASLAHGLLSDYYKRLIKKKFPSDEN